MQPIDADEILKRKDAEIAKLKAALGTILQLAKQVGPDEEFYQALSEIEQTAENALGG